MKELSIEQKAQRYDEAFGKAKEKYAMFEGMKQGDVLEDVFPELKESEDEKIKKAMIKCFKWLQDEARWADVYGSTFDSIFAWLEKQDEQKPNPCDGCVNRKGCINCENGELRETEHKPADKTEPKFENGQWIVWQDKCYKVNYNGCGYELVDQNGLSTSLEYGTIDKNAHLWNITKDAKDGDVLVCPLPKGYEGEDQIFIFKNINSRHYVDDCIEYYCRVCEGVFYENENGYMGTTSSPLYPATKEQRDLLFTKMKEAGYKWDAEKKELKKIEQKSAWSEEDDTFVKAIIRDIENTKYISEGAKKNRIDWLKSLKDRYTWKPSKAQMEALEHFVRSIGESGYACPYDNNTKLLYLLLSDLKKLKS